APGAVWHLPCRTPSPGVQSGEVGGTDAKIGSGASRRSIVATVVALLTILLIAGLDPGARAQLDPMRSATHRSHTAGHLIVGSRLDAASGGIPLPRAQRRALAAVARLDRQGLPAALGHSHSFGHVFA